MSNTNYDAEKPISYNNTYRHYIPYYQVAFPYYEYKTARSTKQYSWGDWMPIAVPDVLKPYTSVTQCLSYSYAVFDAFISFDDGSEEQVQKVWYTISTTSRSASYDKTPSTPYYLNVENVSGVFKKCYFRDPHRAQTKKVSTPFTSSSCYLRVQYNTLAVYEVTLNNEGYVPLTNQTFYCSTVQKNCNVQYPNNDPVVFYKKSSESTYTIYTEATSTGNWSNTEVHANLPLSAGYVYNIKILFNTDQPAGGSGQSYWMQATTNVANFQVTDSTPVTTCISPSGVYTKGTVNFVWSHSTEYGTPQYAYDLQYSTNNGSSWTSLASHVVTSVNNMTATFNTSGVYLWRVRTYNILNQAGSWAQASFINSMPAATPTGLVISTKGRPVLSWVSTTQKAYQVQILRNDKVVYDSGALYNAQNSHIVNRYFDDETAYTGRVRIYNDIGNVSEWASRGYQQPEVEDVVFNVYEYSDGGAQIVIEENEAFTKYYIRRNGVTIGETTGTSYIDKFAVGAVNYEVVGVTSEDYSDIKDMSVKIAYPKATIVTLEGAQYFVNKRVNKAFEVSVNNEADINTTKFVGDSTPTHYFNNMRTRSFQVSFFDDNDIMYDLPGKVVFYGDNFGNGGYCIVSAYEKTDSFIKNSMGVYANEIVLTLEATNYDDSIEYEL